MHRDQMSTNRFGGSTNLHSSSLLAPLCCTGFCPSAPATAHVQVLKNKTKQGRHIKKGVRLSHLVIHRKQACCTSNHTSAAAPSSASTAESSANRRQDSSTTWTRCWHTHTHTKHILCGTMAIGSNRTSHFFHLLFHWSQINGVLPT